MTIVVTGGSGFIGTALTDDLLAQGHTVIVIDRHGPARTHRNLFFIPCDLETSTLPFNVLERTDAIIHLAGADRGSAEMTKHVIASLEETASKPPIFISASNVAYYGAGYDRDLDEKSAMGANERAHSIDAEEKEALKAERFGCRVVIIRTAPVIGRGGFLAPFMRGAAFHIAFRFTKEDFWMPWIQISDLVNVYRFALETNTLQGIVNASAPQPARYTDFTAALARTTRSIIVPVLPFMKWRFRAIKRRLMISQKVVPQRLLDKGFVFGYATLSSAIADAMHAKHHEKN